MFPRLENNLLVAIVFLAFIANHQENGCGASVQVHHQTKRSDFLSVESPQETLDQLKLPKDHELIVRLPSNTLLKYNSYKDVSILHFRVPFDTRTAYFTFKAFEESKSAFQRKCKPRDVSLHLKASSYPVISPENITFPRNFLNADQRFQIYSLQFKSDEVQQRIIVNGPQVGNWFAIAFVSWTDPSNDRIEQQGLAASCDTLLLAEMSVSRFHPIIINNGQVHNGTLTSNSNKSNNKNNNNNHGQVFSSNNVNEDKWSDTEANGANRNSKHFTAASSSSTGTATTTTTTTVPETSQEQRLPASLKKSALRNDNSNMTTNNEIIYKFFVPRNIGVATARITILQVCRHCPDVGFHIQPNAYPYTGMESENINNSNNNNNNNSGDANDESNYIQSTIIKPNQTGQITIEFYVQPNTWHYAVLKFIPPNSRSGTGRSSSSNGPAAAKSAALTRFKLYHELKPPLPQPMRDVTEPLYLYAEGGDGGGGEDEHQQQYHQPETLHHQQRLKRQNPNNFRTNASDNNGTMSIDSYKLVYALQIDYHEPASSDDSKAATDNKRRQSKQHSNDLPKDQSSSTSNETLKTENSQETINTSNKNPWRPTNFRNIEFYPLLRQTYREFFMFDYDLVPDDNGTVPTVLNLTAGTPAGFRFDLGEVYDVGGTLSFAVSMKSSFKASEEFKASPTLSSPSEHSGILAEKLIAPPLDSDNELSYDSKTVKISGQAPRSNQTIIVCMHHGEPGEPTWPDKCRYGRKILPASSIVNNTDSNTSTGLVHVPFPESGQWYVTMGLYCHGAETAARVTIIDSVKDFIKENANMLNDMKAPCACANSATRYFNCLNNKQCLKRMNETETLKVKECLMDSKCTPNYIEMTRRFEVHHKFATEQHFALDNCNSSVMFTISSSPCVAGRCGRFGRCYHYMSGGFVFSTCVCMKGYRGWDCTEDSQVPSSMSILLASLLLTLSNLLFFPSIYMAVRRKYYTEAVIYFFAMFFSIFYHACDSGEDEYSFCLVKIGVLQFCDFYCGLLAIWVTLIAMAHIRPQFVSLLHMLGAILIAFGTEMNKQSLWVFLAPALTGICLISSSWGLKCYKSHKWFPARKYLTVYMPMGMVLVMVGLVCFAFLQTKQNYHIVHSIWHMLMALSILCLLPSRKSFIPKC